MFLLFLRDQMEAKTTFVFFHFKQFSQADHTRLDIIGSDMPGIGWFNLKVLFKFFSTYFALIGHWFAGNSRNMFVGLMSGTFSS